MRWTQSKRALAILVASFVLPSWPSVGQGQEKEAKADKPEPALEATVKQRALVPSQGLELKFDTTAFVDGLSFALAGTQVGTHSIGVTVVPVDTTLRAQLGLTDAGLIVTNVDSNSAAAEAGVAQHDVILLLDGKPLPSPDELAKRVDVIGEKPAGLAVIRGGKKLTLQVTPKRIERLAVTGNPFAVTTQTRFWIGVELASIDDTLRVQLQIPQAQGIVVSNVIEDGPAAKAGIKKHDILLAVGDKPIATEDGLRQMLQEIGEKPVVLKMMREGKAINIEVTPKKYQEPKFGEHVANLVLQPESFRNLTVLDVVRPAAIAGELVTVDGANRQLLELVVTDPHSQVQELIKQVNELQKKLESLSEELKRAVRQ
jgi:membrane-associated protease RseP (regulator of RpoE activity)